MRRLAILLLLALAVAGCSGSAEDRPGSKADPPAATMPGRAPLVTGVVTRLEGGRALVEASPGQQTGDKCWFTIADTTLVATDRDGKAEPAGRSALKVGQRVKAWESGPVLESYPCQAGAEAILILPEAK